MVEFDAFVGTARVRTTARLQEGAERLRGEGVSRGYFDVLGIHAAAGRVLVASDHTLDAPAVVVLSHGTWVRHYGGDPSVINRQLRTERAVYTIVGVAEPGFDGTVEDDVVEFFIPLEQYEPRSLRSGASCSRGRWIAVGSWRFVRRSVPVVAGWLSSSLPRRWSLWRRAACWARSRARGCSTRSWRFHRSGASRSHATCASKPMSQR